jgi:hypothetical protein
MYTKSVLDIFQVRFVKDNDEANRDDEIKALSYASDHKRATLTT